VHQLRSNDFFFQIAWVDAPFEFGNESYEEPVEILHVFGFTNLLQKLVDPVAVVVIKDLLKLCCQ
jgi:hypothetical protein